MDACQGHLWNAGSWRSQWFAIKVRRRQLSAEGANGEFMSSIPRRSVRLVEMGIP